MRLAHRHARCQAHTHKGPWQSRHELRPRTEEGCVRLYLLPRLPKPQYNGRNATKVERRNEILYCIRVHRTVVEMLRLFFLLRRARGSWMLVAAARRDRPPSDASTVMRVATMVATRARRLRPFEPTPCPRSGVSVPRSGPRSECKQRSGRARGRCDQVQDHAPAWRRESAGPTARRAGLWCPEAGVRLRGGGSDSERPARGSADTHGTADRRSDSHSAREWRGERKTRYSTVTVYC